MSQRSLPWVDWQNYWAAGDSHSRHSRASRLIQSLPELFQDALETVRILAPDRRGIRGALLDLEYQRMEMIRFNLFDNGGSYEQYIRGPAGDGTDGTAIKQWLHLQGHDSQSCTGQAIRFRRLDGMCNDIDNPLMGSTGQPFARNVQFETTFPDEARDELSRNRHGGRIGLLKPDPQLISHRLFTRLQSPLNTCEGLPGSAPEATCDYQMANSFNVLAAFWIQFMTHDWFSHLKDGHNRLADGQPDVMPIGRSSRRIDRSDLTEAGKPFSDGSGRLAQAYKTTNNHVTAWWDASQVYGYDQISSMRVKRDPQDRSRLQTVQIASQRQDSQGYLPVLDLTDVPASPQWAGQEATAFPDNWSIGLSFYHNVFAREHNRFVEAFKERALRAKATVDESDDDSGLRNPDEPRKVIRWWDVTDDDLFEVTRLVISAEIAKIHTIEWTAQLLYDEPLYKAMTANWNGLYAGTWLGLFDTQEPIVASALKTILKSAGVKHDEKEQLYSAFAAGPGIIGQGNQHCRLWFTRCWNLLDRWNIANRQDINGGTNHFGSPFNFPEEFVTVYRLHPMVPDLLNYRELADDAADTSNQIQRKIPVVRTVGRNATAYMREKGLANWALSMGRQRLGRLTLNNHPQFLQNLPLDRLGKANRIDVAALDLIRDRERGVPRFNEFRRQYGLRTLTGFDDFIDRTLGENTPELKRQKDLVISLREIYGTHTCDPRKTITRAQTNEDGTPINDCLGHEKNQGSHRALVVDNIEDLDTVVGWLAEPIRPHGFAISETQFQVFILNASRRLFSDRFFTSSFRPEFYSTLGIEWVNNNGPDGKLYEPEKSNGRTVEVSPLKRVLMRTIPELRSELKHVVNVFDPWARDRCEYYSLTWIPRADATSDPDFQSNSAQRTCNVNPN
ncbi:peroxidase family protein [Nitrospira sp. KM1]|uniref:peroxidase family protein n=1 Tax=Nitrospira sp. KM1 TaxID=1936990 RepID=UPI0018D937A0|nr:peroxidase family protein [Nitrospira sp. KM1]